MASPAILGSRALRASQHPFRAAACCRRGYADVKTTGTFQYETGEHAGVKFASRDLPGATTWLSVVARAGTRYQPYPGFADALEKFAFKSTSKRSTLRITREVELLGGETQSYHSREALVLRAKFMKEDLPYFAELLAEVVSKSRYTTHELQEEVQHIMKLHRDSILSNPHELAINSVHAIAFHRGLGVPLYPISSYPTKYLDAPAIADFSDAAYARSNIAVVANGASSHAELSKWVKEFYADTGVGSNAFKIQSTPSKYNGGEERIGHSAGNVMIIGFPGCPSFTSGSGYKPELAVLAALLGGQTSIKWAPGFTLLSKALDKAALTHTVAQISTTQASYSDAGLLLITLTGKAPDVAFAAKVVVDTIKNVAAGKIDKEDLKKATMLAKFRALETGQLTDTGLEATGMGLITGGKAHQIDEIAKMIEGVSEDKVKAAAKGLLESKASVSTVGDLYALPWAEEIGLQV